MGSGLITVLLMMRKNSKPPRFRDRLPYLFLLILIFIILGVIAYITTMK